MSDLVLSNRVQDLVWKERDRILCNVVRLVGRLSDEVVGSMLEAKESKVVDVVSTGVRRYEKPEKASPLNGDARALEEAVEKTVDRVISQKFGDVLQDVSYRIGVLQDVLKAAEGEPSRVTSAQLNLAHHLLDGYTFTNNSPSAGYVAWTDCHIVYQGADNTITNSSTSLKYIYWLQASPSVFQVSDAKPTLGAHDVLVCINESGTANVVLVPGKLRPGAYLLDGTVGTNELGAAAVTNAKLAASAVLSSNIADGAVGTTKLADGAVGTTKLSDSAVTGPKIGAGAVATSKLNLAAHLLY